MPNEEAQFIHELNEAWPLVTEKQYTWPAHYHSIKRAIKGSLPNIKGVVKASHTELNLLVGKTQLFDAIEATPVRKTYFSVPLTAGLVQSFAVPEAKVGDLVKAIPPSSQPEWANMVIKAAWVTQEGRIALHFFKLGTTVTSVTDTGYINILLVRPPA